MKLPATIFSYYSLSIPIIFRQHSFCTSTNTFLHLHSASQCFSLLRTAISTGNLLLGKSTHALIISSSHITANDHRFLTNNLITMYSRCGSLVSARHLFDKMPQRDVVSWNSILAAYAASADTQNNIQEGFRLFRLLLSSSSLSPTKLTLAPLLKLCLTSGHLCASEGAHAYSSKIGLDSDLFVSAALVNIYCKFGRIRDARFLFNDITESDRDAVLWNVMLKAYMQSGFNEETFIFFSEFHRAGLHPDMISLHSVLNGFGKVDFEEGKNYAEQLQAYATKLFSYDDNSDNVIMWNKTLSEYHQSGENRAAIDCFINMNKSCVRCDNVTFVVALASVTAITNLELGQQIHSISLKSGFDLNVVVGNSLINMYSKSGCLASARKVFTYMEEVDLISWNSIITCCAQNGLEEDSVALFIDLFCNGLRPDHFTLAGVLRACSSHAAGLCLSEQINVHALKTGIITDSFVSTALIDVYSRNGRTKEAELLFRNKDRFDLASLNAMMSGYISYKNSHKALELFSFMHKSGERSDEITLATVAKACGSLVGLKLGKQLHAYVVKVGADTDLFISSGILDMYIRCGEMLDAQKVFEGISEPDEVACTAMISGCVENGEEDRAVIIYQQMRQYGIMPDEFTFATLVKATSCLTALEQGKQIHANVIKSDFASDPFVRTALIDMYAKCGEVGDSYRLFKGTDVSNVAVWNAILVGLAQHGHVEEALKLFKNMEFLGIQPDRVTFIGVLSACSHSGLVPDAYAHFNSMHRDHGIKPEIEHYSCLVDALGRSGRVQEAEKLIASMPFEASSSMYRSLLGACRMQGDTETGKRVAARLLALEPADSSAYVLLSNMYAAANQWDEVTYVRKMMKGMNLKKDPGFSWIAVKNEVHLFVVDDRSHPQAEMIYDKLDDLIRMIKKDGYIHDMDYLLLDVEEEERDCSLLPW